jgi:hypothetical protein
MKQPATNRKPPAGMPSFQPAAVRPADKSDRSGPPHGSVCAPFPVRVLCGLFLAAGSLWLGGSALAQQSRVYREGASWVEEVSGSVPAAPNLSIRLEAGNVSVQGGSGQEIGYVMKKRVRSSNEVEARRQFGQFRFAASRNGDAVMLEGGAPGKTRALSGDLSVTVPRTIAFVKAVTLGGNETLEHINGRVEAWTAGGNIDLDDIQGGIVATTGGGKVKVGDAGGDLVLKNGGGNIAVGSVQGSILGSTGGGDIIIGSAAHDATVKTGGGSIEVKRCGGALVASTGGGRLDLGEVAGGATLHTAGGSIRLNAASGPVHAQTGGGTVELLGLTQGANVSTGGGEVIAEFLGGQFSESSLQTPSGDIVVYLVPTLRATVRAAVDVAAGHHIHSDFPEIRISREGMSAGPGTMYAEGSLNGGGPLLRVRAAAGDIEFRRKK